MRRKIKIFAFFYCFYYTCIFVSICAATHNFFVHFIFHILLTAADISSASPSLCHALQHVSCVTCVSAATSPLCCWLVEVFLSQRICGSQRFSCATIGAATCLSLRRWNWRKLASSLFKFRYWGSIIYIHILVAKILLYIYIYYNIYIVFALEYEIWIQKTKGILWIWAWI